MLTRPFALVLLLVGCSDLPDTPQAPDMEALVTAYATPTADLDQAVADDLTSGLRARLDLSAALDELTTFIDEVLIPSLREDAAGAARAADGTSRAVDFAGEGFARIEHICRGWGAEPELDADQSGTLALTVTFTEEGLDPVIWGEMAACHEIIADAEVLLDGEANLWIGENLTFDRFGDSPILFQLVGSLEVDGEEWASADFDIQICPNDAADCDPGSFDLKVNVSGGEHLIFYLNAGRTEGGFRAANGDWPCTIEGSDAVCTSDESGESVTLTGILP